MSAIAKFELEKGVWTELLPWLWNTANSGTAAHREVALQTIFMLLDSIAIAPTQPGGSAQNQIPALLQLLSKTLADPESLAVRVWSIRALGKLSEFVESGEEQEIVRAPSPLPTLVVGLLTLRHLQQSALQNLIPGVVQVLQATLEAGDESSTKSIFEFIENITLSVRLPSDKQTD